MPRMDLIESHVFRGRIYGPGQGVEIPDVQQFVQRVQDVEERAQDRMRRVTAQSMMALPSGHPYRQLFPQVNVQPPEFDGQASTPGDAMFHSPGLDSRALMPDGWTVSGLNAPEVAQEGFARGVQVPTEHDLSGNSQGLPVNAILGSYPPGEGHGESRSQSPVAPVQGYINTPNSTPVTPLGPGEESPTPNLQGLVATPAAVAVPAPMGETAAVVPEPVPPVDADEQPNRPRKRD